MEFGYLQTDNVANLVLCMLQFNDLLVWLMKRRMPRIEAFRLNPVAAQEHAFRHLLQTARRTEWGRKYGFGQISTFREFAERVPVSDYETFFPNIERVMRGEQNVIWPSPIRWFSKSSGTTNARSKFIPVSREALDTCHFQGGKDLIALYVDNHPDTRTFTGKGLSIGGSLSNNDLNPNSQIGDVSAVVMNNLPGWAQYIRTPSLEVALMNVWEEKIERMAEMTARQNVTSILGVPTWTLVLIERILQHTGAKSILEVWPNFEVFCHGAVSFGPYRELFKNRVFNGKDVRYLETYNASEGFFGLQDDLSRPDELLLMLDYGIFYEFIPTDQLDAYGNCPPHPKSLTIGEVEAGQQYAMVISSNAGLWRYLIGDTVRFTSTYPHRIKISGRTKHFLNAFGEEVIVENAEGAIARACEATGAAVSDFTVAPIFMGRSNDQRGRHEWIIEFSKQPADLALFAEKLDSSLRRINSDYDAKRTGNLALTLPLVQSVPRGTFHEWLRRRGKLGGQHKVPRLSNSRQIAEEILQMAFDVDSDVGIGNK